jgi:hypothetical protein
VIAYDIGAVKRYVAKSQKSMAKLPDLDGTKIEDSALSFYRGFQFHYYIPQMVNGVPTWVMNPKDTTVVSDGDTAAGYVAKIRGATIPG